MEARTSRLRRRRPTSYDDYEMVLSEATGDVTRDAREALAKLGVNVLAV